MVCETVLVIDGGISLLSWRDCIPLLVLTLTRLSVSSAVITLFVWVGDVSETFANRISV